MDEVSQKVGRIARVAVTSGDGAVEGALAEEGGAVCRHVAEVISQHKHLHNRFVRIEESL